MRANKSITVGLYLLLQFFVMDSYSQNLLPFISISDEDTIIDYDESIDYKFKMKYTPRKWKYGYKNPEGEVVIKSKFDYARPFCQDYAIAGKYGFKGLINTKGSWILKPTFNCIRDFENNVAVTSMWSGSIVVESFGLIDNKGNIVVDNIFDNIGNFIDGVAIVRQSINHNLINSQGKLLINWNDYDLLYYTKDEVFITEKWNRFGLIDNVGNKITENIYDEIGEFNNGIAPIKVNNKFGYINRNGEEIVEPIFDKGLPIYKNLAIVLENGKWGVINVNGNRVCESKYDTIFPFSCNHALVRKEDKFGFLNMKGDIIKLLFYDGGARFNNGRAKVYQDNKYFFIDTLGNKINDFEFIDARSFSNGIARVKLDGKVYFLDTLNELFQLEDSAEIFLDEFPFLFYKYDEYPLNKWLPKIMKYAQGYKPGELNGVDTLTVKCRIIIEKDGSISDLEIISKSGYEPFDKPIIDNLMKLKGCNKPSLKDGKIVRTDIVINFHCVSESEYSTASSHFFSRIERLCSIP